MRGFPRTARWVAAAAMLAAAVGYAGVWHAEAFFAAAGAAACIALIALADSRPDLVVAGACFVVLVAGTKFRRRDAGASLDGAVDAQVLVELGLYVLLALALAIVWLRRPLRGWRPGVMEAALLGYCVVAAVSVAWSVSPAFTAVRALQLCTLLAVALVAPAVLGARAALRALMRALVAYVLVFAALAAIFPWADGTIADYTRIARFSWFSIHPITAATYAALAALLVLSARLAGGPRAARVFGLPWFLVVPALLAVLLATASRGPLLAFAVALAALLLVRFLPAWANVLVAAFGAVFAAIVVVHGAAIQQLLSAGAHSTGPLARLLFRGQSVAELTTLTGRIQLWADAARLIAAEPVLGHGYQAARLLLLDLRAWAGYAHNALIQTALDLGAVGVLLLFAPLVAVLGAGLNAGRVHAADRFTAIAVFAAAVFLLLNAVTSESFAGAPGFEVLLLFSCVTIRARLARVAEPLREAAPAHVLAAARWSTAQP